MLKLQLQLFLLALCLSWPAYADTAIKDQVFHINTPLHPPTTTRNHDGFEDMLAMELFGRLGFKNIHIDIVPAERGLLNLNNGIDDAILTRVAGLEKTYPNIVRIPEVANMRGYTAFTQAHIKIKNWDDLKDYDVAYINGWKIFDNNVTKYRSLTKVRGPEQLFRLLEKKRVDVVLYGHDAGMYMLKKLGMKNIKPVEPALANKKKYFYVNKKHADLIPMANRILRQIKQDGSYEKLKQKTMATYN
jgi:polar amino acid transport system substrate-binding protein